MILRLVVSFEFPNIYHPDETYQTLEQARRRQWASASFLGNSRDVFVLGPWALPGVFAGFRDFSRLRGRAIFRRSLRVRA